MDKVVIIVQARLGSSRLPGKIMLPLAGQPLIKRMLERLHKVMLCSDIIVATTVDESDDIIEKLCRENNWHCYRGHSTDLLDRHYKAALQFNADIVLKIPSDCPLIDFRIVDEVLRYFLSNDFEYVSNLHPASYPDGNDVEVMSINALEIAWKEAERDFEREHCTPYIWENPQKFRIGNYFWKEKADMSMTHRFTIDYPEDYQFIKTVFEELYPVNNSFSLNDILQLLESHPHILELNRKYAGVNWYRHHMEDLKTIQYSQTKII